MTELLGLERLLSKGLTQDEEALARRYYSDSERQSMDEGDFCGPHRSFPVNSAADVSNAAHLIGHADDSEAVKACIIRKAKANGWPLPDAWKEDDKQDRAVASDGPLSMFAPITRIDKDEWLIEGLATTDAVDSYGTIFDYESSKKAFEKWRGNIRYMHKNEAVGRAVELQPDDTNRSIFLRARISKGARDTWEKILDGTLSGFSISVPEGHYKTKSVVRNGKSIPVYYDHDLAEVSVVDAPGNDKCNFVLARADGLVTELVDTSEEETPNTTTSLVESSLSPPLDRAGARLSLDSRAALHEMRDRAMSLCGCEECTEMQATEPDGDEDMERKITGMIERAISPVYARLQGIAGSLARSNASSNNTNIASIISGAITRAVEAVAVKSDASLSEVRAELSAVKETVVRIDNTPMPGAPIMNTATTRPPVTDKSLPTDPVMARSTNSGATYDAMVQQFAQMSRANQFQTLDDQLAAAGRVLATQPPPNVRR